MCSSDLNPNSEDLQRLEEALKNLQNKSQIEEVVEEPVETEETTKYFVDDEEVVVEETPETSPLPEETQDKIRRLSYTKDV